jgi:bla regulator protein blaR1
MKKIVYVVCLWALCWGIGRASLLAQSTPQTPPVSFEVTSVKPSNPNPSAGMLGSIPMMMPQGVGRLTASNMPLRMLVRMAYGVQDFQIVGGPTWQTSNKYDIVAKAVDGTTTGTQDLLPMMKSLLAERFKLKTHTETRELPTYALVVARSDGKLGRDLKPSTSDCSGAAAEAQKRADALLKGGPTALAALLPKPGDTWKCAMMPAIDPANPAAGFGLRADGQPLTILTQLLTQVTGRTVIDKTGLTGLYDWELRFDPQVFMQMASQMGLNVPALGANAASPFSDSPSLLTALQEQLGLKLDSQKGPVEVLVIDSAELPEPD